MDILKRNKIYEYFELAKSIETIKEINLRSGLLEHDNKIYELGWLLKFIDEIRYIQINFSYFSISTSWSSFDSFEFKARQMCIIINSIITPLRFNLSNISINGRIKGMIWLDKIEWIVIDAEKIHSSKINMHYDLSNGLFQNEEYFFLRKLSTDQKKIFTLIKIQDLIKITPNKLWNISILSKSNSTQNMKVLQNCEGYLLYNLIHDLKPIPRNISIQLNNFCKVEPWLFEDINSDFWSLIIEFKSIEFECKNEIIKLIWVTHEFDKENLHKNNFKVSIRGIDKVVNYSQLIIMVN